MSRALDRIGTWIGWAFFADLANGLALTFGYMFSRSVTMQYPDKEKWLPYSRYRGHHFLKRDEEGEIKCVACELCARICPCDCIEVVPYEDENGKREPHRDPRPPVGSRRRVCRRICARSRSTPSSSPTCRRTTTP